jgi:hypothetical protein
MKRIGTVLVFKKDVSPEEAAKALEQIREVLDLPEKSFKMEILPGKRCRTHEVPFTMPDKIEEYDDEYGGPVWYIP